MAVGNRIFIGVGTNIAPEENLKKTISLLKEKVIIKGISTFYRTEALDRPLQEDYLNGVIEIGTSLPPRRLKNEVLIDIEYRLKRVRARDRYAPRTIDLDLILYNDLVMVDEDMVLPNPDIRNRWFVAAPLDELAPDLIMPDSGETLKSVLEKMSIPVTAKIDILAPYFNRSKEA